MIAPQVVSAAIETPVSGRILVRAPRDGSATGVLLGYHGYAETADVQLDRLTSIPGSDGWILVSVQGLNRFYRPRTQETVASWMTRQDREQIIAANITYVNRVVAWVRENVTAAAPHVLVHAGFSQGAAMAFRAAVRGSSGAAGVISVGGDVPPELLADPSVRWPPVMLARGTRDEWYTQARFDADVAALRGRSVEVTPLVFDGDHAWTPEVSDHVAGLLRRWRRHVLRATRHDL